jgi:hypothetical protein
MLRVPSPFGIVSPFGQLRAFDPANLFAPTITSAPQITGDPVAGETVTITNATASGTPTPTVTPTLALGGTDVTGDMVGGAYQIPPGTTVGTTLTLTSVASNGILPDAQDSVSVTVQDGVFTPASLFAGGIAGAWYGPSDLSTLFQDSAGTTPVTTAGQPVGLMLDNSGNGNHAVQATAAARPTYQTGPARATLDKVDDRMTVTVPTGGFTGTMVLATDQGTASYGVNIPAGPYEIGGSGGRYFPGNALVGQVIRDGALSAGDAAATEADFVEKGATASYGAVTDFSSFWRNWSEIISFPLINTSSGTSFKQAWYKCTSLTSFPLIDTSSGTNFNYAWSDCAGLTSFPLIDTSSGTNFNRAWLDCRALTSFPLIDTSSGTDFGYAWYDCESLTTIPAGLFDNVSGGDFTGAFTGTALTQTSIDNVLVSLVTSGIAAGTREFGQSGGSAPSSTGEAAIDTLRSRGWTVTVTGGY